MVTKNELIEMLKERVVNVTFTKVDGTVRTMLCTLSEKYVEFFQDNPAPEENINSDVVVVWDTEKQDWRSFRYDSVLEVL